MNAKQVADADRLYARGVTTFTMLAQNAGLADLDDQRTEFLALAHELRQKRFQLLRKTPPELRPDTPQSDTRNEFDWPEQRPPLTPEEHNAYPHGRYTFDQAKGGSDAQPS